MREVPYNHHYTLNKASLQLEGYNHEMTTTTTATKKAQTQNETKGVLASARKSEVCQRKE